MEFLPTNLSSCLDRYGILSDEISYSILHEVSLGLSYLHGQTPPIVHRDLSANNVLLSKDMTAKISDLGVAKILNLTPLQMNQMTGTPGTPAYMPPEVMVADPRYDTSVDVFSFGVMMIHTFTAEWPLPKVGPTRTDPNNPDRLLGVSEAERREEFLRMIAQDHPLMDLIMRCLSNNPQRRPRAEEIVGRMEDIVLQYPPSFENRVEMLQRISTLNTEKRELEREISVKLAENKRLKEEKQQQKEENESIIERIKLSHCVETEQLHLENRELRSQLEDREVVVEELRQQNTEALAEVEQQIANVNFSQRENTANSTTIAELEKEAIQQKRASTARETEALLLTSQIQSLRTQVANLTSQAEQNRATINSKEADLLSKENEASTLTSQVATLTMQAQQDRVTIQSKDRTITSKETDIAAKDKSLQNKETTIQSLNTQLTRTRDYLTSKPQVVLSYSQCSEAPVEICFGSAVSINDKVYYGGGEYHEVDDNNYVHCFSVSQNEWSTLPKLPVWGFGLGEVLGDLVTVGGLKHSEDDMSNNSKRSSEADAIENDGNSTEYSSVKDVVITNEIYVLDEASQTWKQTIPPMPTARALLAVVSLPSHVVAAGGGLDFETVTDIVEVYNVSTSQWSKTDCLPYACGDPKVAVCNNTVYLVGGWGGTEYLSKVAAHQLDQLIANSEDTNQLEDAGINSDSHHNSAWEDIANTPWCRPSALAVSGMVLAIGGLNSQNEDEYEPTHTICAYSASMESWVYTCDLPSRIADAATVAPSSTEFLMTGGQDEYNEYSKVYKCSIKPKIS